MYIIWIYRKAKWLQVTLKCPLTPSVTKQSAHAITLHYTDRLVVLVDIIAWRVVLFLSIYLSLALHRSTCTRMSSGDDSRCVLPTFPFQSLRLRINVNNRKPPKSKEYEWTQMDTHSKKNNSNSNQLRSHIYMYMFTCTCICTCTCTYKVKMSHRMEWNYMYDQDMYMYTYNKSKE